ncbi:MAG: fatty acid oxidation complex subunit alpha FadB [Deltaproteobacteria bacterium]|nr:fatty acid oxidation complex subunit alpha FadB [Deltaproteobacteria bacterium]
MSSTISSGQAITLKEVDGGFVELTFDLKDESVNKFNAVTLHELKDAVAKLKARGTGLRGLLITSGKDAFIAGADITEFGAHFKNTEEALAEWLGGVNATFSALEDLAAPTVVALKGFALGGGFELPLTAAYRVAAEGTKVGLPETKLGIYPGWGGTVRLSRLIGADNAIEWIAGGKNYSADDALKYGAVDAVVPGDKLRDAALAMLKDAADGKLDWRARQETKRQPLKLNAVESTMVFEGAKAFVAAQAGPNYPAPLEAIDVIAKGARLTRDEALKLEARGFAKVAKTPAAASLVSIFLADQYVKKVAKKHAKQARPVKSAAVLGAGIMGGGISFVSATSKIPVFMKDINDKALELGMTEAVKLLDKQVSRGKLTPAKMAAVVASIHPTLNYTELKHADIVVEAVTENEKVKRAVLKDVEDSVGHDTIITSNTSTISITGLAEALSRPQNFCGMHFFNPVPKMPLVEIIRGKKSSDEAIATTVAYATAMGKTPVVVNDCPGFYINRVLFPYFGGFIRLLRDGVDFQKIDKVMTKFGWPMGPAYLLDVVGIDTAHHANAVMAAAYPDRMSFDGRSAIDVMFDGNRYGQKNLRGFFVYAPDKKGIPQKAEDKTTYELLKPVVKGNGSDVSDEEIVDRMMLPMLIESARCLEEKIIDSPAEADLSLVYGLGFPPFRGGVHRWADQVGVAELVKRAEKYAKHGKMYEPSSLMLSLAKSGKKFYPET